MSRKKLQRIHAVKTFENVFDLSSDMKGKWHEYFQNKNPLVLEIGCGRGAYTTGLAELHPERNYIGVDRKADRIWHGSTYAKQHNLSNAAFLHIPMNHITKYFSKNEVSEIWITFPDPYEKEDQTMKRLTSTYFLDVYEQFLSSSGCIHLKTDSHSMVEHSCVSLAEKGYAIQTRIDDLYAMEAIPDELQIQTPFEQKWLKLGRKISYVQFYKPASDAAM